VFGPADLLKEGGPKVIRRHDASGTR